MKKFLLLLALCTPACSTNLQASYVQSMIETRKVIMLDVKAGLYKPDAVSAPVLDKWAKANADAKDVLVKEGKWPETDK